MGIDNDPKKMGGTSFFQHSSEDVPKKSEKGAGTTSAGREVSEKKGKAKALGPESGTDLQGVLLKGLMAKCVRRAVEYSDTESENEFDDGQDSKNAWNDSTSGTDTATENKSARKQEEENFENGKGKPPVSKLNLGSQLTGMLKAHLETKTNNGPDYKIPKKSTSTNEEEEVSSHDSANEDVSDQKTKAQKSNINPKKTKKVAFKDEPKSNKDSHRAPSDSSKEESTPDTSHKARRKQRSNAASSLEENNAKTPYSEDQGSKEPVMPEENWDAHHKEIPSQEETDVEAPHSEVEEEGGWSSGGFSSQYDIEPELEMKSDNIDDKLLRNKVFKQGMKGTVLDARYKAGVHFRKMRKHARQLVRGIKEASRAAKGFFEKIFSDNDNVFTLKHVFREVSYGEQRACIKYCNPLIKSYGTELQLSHDEFNNYNEKIEVYKKHKKEIESLRKAGKKFGLSQPEKAQLSSLEEALQEVVSEIEEYKAHFEGVLKEATDIYENNMGEFKKAGHEWLYHVDQYLKSDDRASENVEKQKKYLDYRLNAKLDTETKSKYGMFSDYKKSDKELLISVVVSLKAKMGDCDRLIKSIGKSDESLREKMKNVEKKRSVDIRALRIKTRGLSEAGTRREAVRRPPRQVNRAPASRRKKL